MTNAIQPFHLLVIALAGWLKPPPVGGMLNYYYREAARKSSLHFLHPTGIAEISKQRIIILS